MKKLRSLILFMVVVVLICISASFIITKYYEQDLKVFVVDQINRQLDTEVEVADVELTVFKKFPYTSLEFKKVLARDALITIGEKDTFFYFNHAYLQFNLIDILQNRFILREITLEDGFIRPKINKEGYDNYHIFKTKEKEENDFLINLKKVALNDVAIDYINEPKNDRISFVAEKAYLKGAFSKKEFELDIYGDFLLNQAQLKSKLWGSRRKIKMDFGIYVNRTKAEYVFRRGDFTVDKQLDFLLAGSISGDENTEYDLKIEGNNLDLIKSVELLPETYQSEFEAYNSKGDLSFSGTLKGISNQKKSPVFVAKFQISNGLFADKKTNLKVEKIDLQGNFNSDGFLELAKINGRVRNSNFSGKFKMEGFNYPNVSATITGEFDLKDIKDLLRLDTLSHLSGKMNIDASYAGKIKDLSSISKRDIQLAVISGEIQFIEAAFRIKGMPHEYKNFNSTVTIHNNDMLIKGLHGYVDDTDISLNGLFQNAFSYFLIEGQQLIIEAEVMSKHLDLNQLLSSENEKSADTAYFIRLPSNIQLNLKTSVEELYFRRFTATQITGIVQYSGQKIKISPFRFNTMDGNFSGSCLFYGVGNENYQLVTETKITDIDISKLFYDLENFGQSIFTDSHLKGKTDAMVSLKLDLNQNLQIDPKKVYANIGVEIRNGELNNFEPLYNIPGYIKSHKILSLFVKADELQKRLEHIKFTTLRNQILIQDKIINIPRMDIKTSAMNIEAEGTHSFDNMVDYKVSFYLSELLTKDPENTDSEGKTKVFLTIKGPANSPEINYDKNASRQKRKNDINDEKIEIKQVMKDEFGLFHNDTSLKKVNAPEDKLEFMIEWDEQENQSVKDSVTVGKQNNKIDKQWFNDIVKKKEKKNTDDFDFDEDDDF